MLPEVRLAEVWFHAVGRLARSAANEPGSPRSQERTAPYAADDAMAVSFRSLSSAVQPRWVLVQANRAVRRSRSVERDAARTFEVRLLVIE